MVNNIKVLTDAELQEIHGGAVNWGRRIGTCGLSAYGAAGISALGTAKVTKNPILIASGALAGQLTYLGEKGCFEY